eukprot:352414-Chlamydomonas_euryale.AAC.4
MQGRGNRAHDLCPFPSLVNLQLLPLTSSHTSAGMAACEWRQLYVGMPSPEIKFVDIPSLEMTFVVGRQGEEGSQRGCGLCEAVEVHECQVRHSGYGAAGAPHECGAAGAPHECGAAGAPH